MAPLVLAFAACDTTDPDLVPDPVTNPALVGEWQALLMASIQDEVLYPPAASRVYAYAGVALYEGLVHGYPDRRSLAGQLNGLVLPTPDDGQAYDWYAVASTTVRHVVHELLKDGSTGTHAAVDALGHQQVQRRRDAGVPPDVMARSIDFGEKLGAAIAAWCRTDGYEETRDRAYTPPTGDGYWVPTPPYFEAALEPYWGTLRTLALDDADVCDTVGEPPPYSTDPDLDFFQEVREVYDTSLALTEEERAIALFWADDAGVTGTPAGHWVSIARQLNQQLDLSLIEAAETFALVGIGLNDAFITAWRTKYRTNYIRPVTVIRQTIDPDWLPLVDTPPFPEFTSGHSVGSGTMGTVLSYLHGDHVSFVDNTHAGRGMAPRSFHSFHEAAEEASHSRLYGGIHFAQARIRGLAQGACVGTRVITDVRTRR